MSQKLLVNSLRFPSEPAVVTIMLNAAISCVTSSAMKMKSPHDPKNIFENCMYMLPPDGGNKHWSSHAAKYPGNLFQSNGYLGSFKWENFPFFNNSRNDNLIFYGKKYKPRWIEQVKWIHSHIKNVISDHGVWQNWKENRCIRYVEGKAEKLIEHFDFRNQSLVCKRWTNSCQNTAE